MMDAEIVSIIIMAFMEHELACGLLNWFADAMEGKQNDRECIRGDKLWKRLLKLGKYLSKASMI